MTRLVGAIVTWAKNQPTANLLMIIYWCSIAITFICEVAAITILATINLNHFQDQAEIWMAAWFFAVNGGIAWIVASQCLASEQTRHDRNPSENCVGAVLKFAGRGARAERHQGEQLKKFG